AVRPAVGADAAPGVPADVRDGQDKALAFLNSLKGKSEADVVQLLGPPAERGTWKFRDRDQPKLRYDVAKKSRLSLYFFNGHVVNADFQLMSE
ncbi:MAG: hypothetical protein JWO31_1692, partial [Phycisphaerales bacterium]|nr:hypothetical protein [Phycisphaerales bacterium]